MRTLQKIFWFVMVFSFCLTFVSNMGFSVKVGNYANPTSYGINFIKGFLATLLPTLIAAAGISYFFKIQQSERAVMYPVLFSAFFGAIYANIGIFDDLLKYDMATYSTTSPFLGMLTSIVYIGIAIAVIFLVFGVED